MELNRYESVKLILKHLDLRILKSLQEEKPNVVDISTLTDTRSTFIEELKSLEKGMSTHELFNKTKSK